MSVRFRPLLLEDVARVVAIDDATDIFPWRIKNYLEGLDAGYSSWVLTDGDEVIGFAIMMLVLDEAHLLKITVTPERQGQGLGTGFLAHLYGRAKEAHATQMFLEVRQSNDRARGLYGREGFVEIGQRKAYYPKADGREDAIVMRRELT